jgi:pyridoxamine 5'-phosphate oxidase
VAPPTEPSHSRPLLESEASPEPFAQFAKWYAEAAEVVRAPEAVAVATASVEGRPSARMVLMKAWDKAGFVFYTNYDSRKGRDLEANPHAALLFHWDPLGRQVRIEGTVSHVSGEESDRYFSGRPFGARIGAWASHQSETVASRDVLDERVRELAGLHGDGESDGEVPRPEWWGGYRLSPEVFEFWQSRDDRLHDRLRYSRAGATGWLLERLQP